MRHHWFKRDNERRPFRAIERDGTVELIDEPSHELQAKGFRVSEIKIFREANPVVAHGKDVRPYFIRAQADSNRPLPSIREGVLKGVRDELVNDETARDGGRDINARRATLSDETH